MSIDSPRPTPDPKTRVLHKMRERINTLKTNITYTYWHTSEYFIAIDLEPVLEYLDLLVFYSVLRGATTSKTYAKINTWFARLSSGDVKARIGEQIYILYQLSNLDIETLRLADDDEADVTQYHSTMYS